MSWQKSLLMSLILTSLFVTSCREPTKKEETIRFVKAIQVEDPSLILTRPFPGVARAEDRVNLSFRVDGPLVELPIVVGDQVKKGDVLARIDPRDYEINLRNVEANLAKSQATLKFAESDFARADRIQKKDPGAISESKVDEKREERNRLRAVVEGNVAQVEGANDQLSYTRLIAPFNGTIVAKYFDNFEYVRARQAVARMLDTSQIEMVIDVPDHMIPYANMIQDIEVTFRALPGLKLNATIKEIGEEASTTTRTFPVTLLMKQPKDNQVFAGMSGEARFIGSIEPDSPYASIIIPTTSVFSEVEDGPKYVWVIDDKTHITKKREVKVGKLTSRGIQVISGINPGEWIAIAGVHFLKDGQKVKLLGQEEKDKEDEKPKEKEEHLK